MALKGPEMTAHDPRVTLTEAEMRRLTDAFASSTRAPGHLAFLAREVVESILAARLAPIRALVDEWQDLGDVTCGGCDSCDGAQRHLWYSAADALRAALDAPVSASQDHDGAEGQGEGELAGEARSMFSTCCYYVGTPSCRCPNPTPDYSDITKRRP